LTTKASYLETNLKILYNLLYIMDFTIPKYIDFEALDERIKTPMTDADLERYFGSGIESEIMTYAQLANYRTIDELLPNPIDFRIILVEQMKNKGHWVLILKYNGIIENFDSYGKGIEAQRGFIAAGMNRLLGQSRNHLSRLVARSPYKYIVNKHGFQSTKPDVNTCGRWCCLRIIMAKELKMDLPEFTEMVKKASRDMRLIPDAVVSLWIK
jgi:hypothetical protein